MFLSSSDFLLGIRPECQTVWIQNRSNALLGLIQVQTVYKGDQQTTLVGKELMRGIFISEPITAMRLYNPEMFEGDNNLTDLDPERW